MSSKQISQFASPRFHREQRNLSDILLYEKIKHNREDFQNSFQNTHKTSIILFEH